MVAADEEDNADVFGGDGDTAAAAEDSGDSTGPGGLLPPDASARADVAETQAVTDYLCAAGDGASTHVNTSTDPAKAGVIRAFNDPRRVMVTRLVRPADESDSSDPEGAGGSQAPPRPSPVYRGSRRAVEPPKAAAGGRATTTTAAATKRPPLKCKRVGGAFATVKRRKR